MEDAQRIQARDGLELVAYLTRAKADKPTPLVLCVHGGPLGRDFWGFNSAAQWFANRGYACLQVNYRGAPATASPSCIRATRSGASAPCSTT